MVALEFFFLFFNFHDDIFFSPVEKLWVVPAKVLWLCSVKERCEKGCPKGVLAEPNQTEVKFQKSDVLPPRSVQAGHILPDATSMAYPSVGVSQCKVYFRILKKQNKNKKEPH